MTGRVLLDTNIIIALFAQDSVVKNRLTAIEEVFIPIVALGELFFGAHKSSKNILREIGRPIPENDIWIAAIALQNQLTVLTRDAHFSEIPSLQLELW